MECEKKKTENENVKLNQHWKKIEKHTDNFEYKNSFIRVTIMFERNVQIHLFISPFLLLKIHCQIRNEKI